MGNTNRIRTVLYVESEGKMTLVQIDGNDAMITLTDEDVETIKKYAHREEITVREALAEAINNGIEELAFKKG